MTTSVTRVPAAVKKVVPLDVQVHLGPAGFPDRFGMASDLTSQLQRREGGTAQVRMWAQVLGQTWVLAAKEPLPGKNWICWADGLWSKNGGSLFGGHGGSKDRLKLLQASQLGDPIAGKGELAVVGGPVTRQAVRLRIQFRNGPSDRAHAPRRWTPIPGQVLRRVLPATSQDGLDARTRGRLRQGGPPHRRVLCHDSRG